MVKDYITGIEWCINYYLDDCISWKWGYNFAIAPLISDIIKYYPKKIILVKNECELNPIEQLILAIPPETYKYVISNKIIEKLKKQKRIGYMFPESFDLDINKESVYWKCQVKIPMVEYEEYISIIKLLNILDVKNNFESSIKNF
jgi:5'-3' exonuclease